MTVAANNGIEKGPLLAFIERIEKLDEERQTFVDDIKEVKSEAKSSGYDMKALNAVLARRKKGREKVKEEEEMIALYEHSLGLFD